MSLTIPQLIEAIQQALHPELLKKGYGKSGHWLAGHCYVAAEALYHLLPDHQDWRPMQGTGADGQSHWWLQHKNTAEVLDPTADQYYDFGKMPPYMYGHGCGFLTKQPSKRAQQVIRRLHATTLRV